MESNREIWTILLLNAFAVPAAVYLLVTNTFQLDSEGRFVLATVLGPCGLGLTMWRWWSAVRRNLES
jgi:hypothetical protein